MANVEFNSVKKSTYDGLGANVSDGALYFIKDNGEIRKGGKHVTGARVYTATDPDGTTAVDALSIKLDGTDISTSGFTELPKKGDMLLVEQYLSLTDETYWEKDGAEVTEGTEGATQKTRKVRDPNGTKGYSSYVYAHNGPITITEDVGGTPTAVTYAYHPSGWQACCENVDASKVILTQDYTLAGNYTSVGNLNKGTEYKAAGKSVADALKDIFTKKLEPSQTPTNPSFTLSGSNVYREVGTLYTCPEIIGTWKDGSYTYGAWVRDGVTQTATGTTVGTWTISTHDDQDQDDATKSGNTATITPAKFRVANATEETLATFSVTNNISNTLPAATNIKTKGNPEVKITKTTNTAQSRTITGYQQIFTGYRTGSKHLSGVDDGYYTANTNGTPTIAANWHIRSATTARTDSNSTAKPATITTAENTIQVMVAVPSSMTLTAVKDANASDADITGNFLLTNMDVGGADSTNESLGSYAKAYKVYVWTPSAKLAANTYKLTISG